jgi:hypothetical protein
MRQLLACNVLVELSPLKKNEDCECELNRCPPTVLKMFSELVRELPRWINEHPLAGQVSRQERVGRRTMR